jgi:hypothetical protein
VGVSVGEGVSSLFTHPHPHTHPLSRQWLGQLADNTTESSTSKLKSMCSLISFGLLSPSLREYRSADTADEAPQKTVNLFLIQLHLVDIF